ncbi:hypothetical protein BS47DRAFT_1359100 [Hydnum rufescens UP504]|uniref:Uncharacterized protein n=1 Tax=Hydnum rufescens UP504 TaxID=1448309 RepID=A0A9P6B5E3_9AGAM|nr:hypothetical protein BS47DRAFT_1359100 [Hydnum rufescens UP504]
MPNGNMPNSGASNAPNSNVPNEDATTSNMPSKNVTASNMLSEAETTGNAPNEAPGTTPTMVCSTIQNDGTQGAPVQMAVQEYTQGEVHSPSKIECHTPAAADLGPEAAQTPDQKPTNETRK